MTTAPPQESRIDHLVVAAASLAEGVQWCEKSWASRRGQAASIR